MSWPCRPKKINRYNKSPIIKRRSSNKIFQLIDQKLFLFLILSESEGKFVDRGFESDDLETEMSKYHRALSKQESLSETNKETSTQKRRHGQDYILMKLTDEKKTLYANLYKEYNKTRRKVSPHVLEMEKEHENDIRHSKTILSPSETSHNILQPKYDFKKGNILKYESSTFHEDNCSHSIKYVEIMKVDKNERKL